MIDCRQARDLLDRDSQQLTGGERRELAAHVDACASCAADRNAAARLAALAAALPRWIEPPIEAWPAIRARLRPRRGLRPTLPQLLAASIALVAATAAATALLIRTTQAPLEVAPPPAPALVHAPATRSLDADEAGYRSAADALTAELAAQERTLSPRTVEVVRRNLAVIDAAIAEGRAAIERDPANAGLRALLRATYDQKLRLLQRVMTLPQQS
jgi:hypothetical protein